MSTRSGSDLAARTRLAGPRRWRRSLAAAALSAVALSAVALAGCAHAPAAKPAAGATTLPAVSATTPTTVPRPSSSGPAPTASSRQPTTTTGRPPTTTPGPALPASLVGTEWTRLPTGRKLVALTFDAGAGDQGVDKTLRALAAAGVPGTFFLTGRWAQQFPKAAAAIAARYPFGNHTDTHPDLRGLSDAAVRAQVTAAAAHIRAATGRDPLPLFRFPYGGSDRRTIALVNQLGYGAIRWTVDTLGWKGTSGGQTTATVQQRVLAGLVPGEIVLLHLGANPDDGSTLDADALPALIAALRARGYQFTTVDRYL